MRTYRFLTAAVVCLTFIMLAASLAAAQTPEEFSVNGLKVILKTNPANDIISAQLYVRGGVFNLTDSTQGIEPLMFDIAEKGSKKYPKETLFKILDRTAASISNSSTHDYSSISLRCLKRQFDEMWDVFADVVMNPAFNDEDVKLVRNTMLINIGQRKDNPDNYLRELSNDVFYQGHTYRLNPDGIESSVSAISVEQMKNHLRENLITSKLLLVVVGNTTKEELTAKLEKTFGKLPRGTYAAPVIPPVQHSSTSLKVEEKKMPTNYIRGTFSVPNQTDPDYYAMRVAINVLRYRLFEEVRTKRNLSYAPSAGMGNEMVNRAFIYVTAVQADTTIKVMFAELKKLQTEPLTEKMLKDRVAMFLTEYYTDNETNSAQTDFLADCELIGNGWKTADSFMQHIRNVTAADIQRVANKYFHNFQMVVIGDPKVIDTKVFTAM
jgi:zinc protease